MAETCIGHPFMRRILEAHFERRGAYGYCIGLVEFLEEYFRYDSDSSSALSIRFSATCL
jgi:pyrroloquinoline quinone (PQQ) biosynthesis protein C